MSLATKYDVPSADVLQEQQFYTDVTHTNHNIDALKTALQARNEEFRLLQEYYERNRGFLDVHHRPSCGPRAMRPNLGTADQTWYYLDGAGNKIWVRNLELDTSDPKSGAFQRAAPHGYDGESAEDRIVVVQIPRVRYNYSVQQDYRRKLAEYDASYKLPVSERTRRLLSSSARGGRHAAGWQHQTDGLDLYDLHHSETPEKMGVERYIAGQHALANQIEQVRPSHRAEYVWRPPSSIEEAEARLAELKREAAQLEAQREQQAVAAAAAAARAKSLQL